MLISPPLPSAFQALPPNKDINYPFWKKVSIGIPPGGKEQIKKPSLPRLLGHTKAEEKGFRKGNVAGCQVKV